MLERVIQRIEQRLFAHHPHAPALVRASLYTLRFPYALAHDIWRGELTLRAVSLVYTTLLSVVPLLALVFSILKGLGYHRELEPALRQFFEPMGARGAELTAQVMHFVDNARGDVLGSLGVAFFLYTAISMIQKVEESFNAVWRVTEPRSLARRVGEYLGVLTVGPTLIAAAIGLMATLSNQRLVQALKQAAVIGPIWSSIGAALPYLLVMAVFAFLYAFVPNTKVRLRAALIGGVVGGFLWVGSGLLFASFVGGAKGTMLIYASFAIVILALVWLHISWLVLMIGAQLAFYVQHPQYLQPGAGEERLTPSLSERLALSVMYLLGQSFTRSGAHARKRYTLNALAERLHIAGTTLGTVVDRLESAGLILVTDDDRLIPGRDLAHIKLTEILDAIRCASQERTMLHIRSIAEADAVASKANDALRASLQDRTLTDLVAHPADVIPAATD